jgi:prophage regulatory protein
MANSLKPQSAGATENKNHSQSNLVPTPPVRSRHFHQSRLPQVLTFTGLKRATLYKLISRAEFPRQVQISDRDVAWITEEVQAWMAAGVTASRCETAIQLDSWAPRRRRIVASLALGVNKYLNGQTDDLASVLREEIDRLWKDEHAAGEQGRGR